MYLHYYNNKNYENISKKCIEITFSPIKMLLTFLTWVTEVTLVSGTSTDEPADVKRVLPRETRLKIQKGITLGDLR